MSGPLTFIGGAIINGEWCRINGEGFQWGSDGFGGWGSFERATEHLLSKGATAIPGGVEIEHRIGGSEYQFADRIVLRSFADTMLALSPRELVKAGEG